MDSPTLDLRLCRHRQQRLLEAVEPLGLDRILLSRPESVQWLTGLRLGPSFSVSTTIDINGHTTLVVPERSAASPAAVDEVVGYEAKWHSTMRNDMRAACSLALVASIDSVPTRIGCEFTVLDQFIAGRWNAELADLEPLLFDLRRHKDEDELTMMGWANKANRAMYDQARRIIEPGINELEVYNELQAVAVRQVGEALTYFGQDFQCNSRGGPPRDRKANSGELYILDLGVGYRGYYSDNARTVIVGDGPSDEQHRAWEQIVHAFEIVESQAKPGVCCRELFADIDKLLNTSGLGLFDHHLGHGVGLAPHEGPHLNPRWDDFLEEGDFFTVEPGLYDPRLRNGIRLEQNYLVTDTGVELLTDWPLEL